MPTFQRLSAGCAAALLCTLAACSWAVPADPARRRERLEVGSPASTQDARGPQRANAALPPRARSLDAASPQGATLPAAQPRTQDADPGAAAIYASRCSQCHEAFDPGHAPASAWPGLVAKYGPRAGLFGAERTRVIRWLQAHASVR